MNLKRVGAALLLLGLVAGTISAQYRDDEMEDSETEPGKPKAKLVTVGQLTGKIDAISKDSRKFVLEIEGQIPVWNRSNARRSRTPPRVQVRKQKYELDVKLWEDAQVRLPIDVDDYETRKLLKESKDRLPGRPGSIDDLEKGQVVQVTFGQTREKQPVVYATLVLVIKDKLK